MPKEYSPIEAQEFIRKICKIKTHIDFLKTEIASIKDLDHIVAQYDMPIYNFQTCQTHTKTIKLNAPADAAIQSLEEQLKDAICELTELKDILIEFCLDGI
jgi:hypothetical protein